jgi:hypothetical protein
MCIQALDGDTIHKSIILHTHIPDDGVKCGFLSHVLSTYWCTSLLLIYDSKKYLDIFSFIKQCLTTIKYRDMLITYEILTSVNMKRNNAMYYYYYTLKMEGVSTSETLLPFYQTYFNYFI